MIGRFSKLGSYREFFDLKQAIRIGLGGALALVGYLLMENETPFYFLGRIFIFASIFINGVPIIWGAFQGVLKKQINVDELVSLAIIASLFAGEFLSAAVVSFVMMTGALMEEATAESARRAIHSLMKITPKNATAVAEDGTEKVLSISDIEVGHILLIKPGERIPVDGTVTEGMTAVDESALTGEPIPVEKSVGDTVYSGGLNHNGVIKIRTKRKAENSTLGRVVKLVSEAEAHRPESTGMVDRYAKWFTPAILACATLAWALTGELNRAVTVLIVGCPCALILAAPTAIVAAISRAARAGILVKGGRFLEKAAGINVVLFDKTGTLTEGKPKVDKVVPAGEFEATFVLKQAACVEKNSTHPLARAVLMAAHYAKIAVQSAENLMTRIGMGVSGYISGCTVAVGNVHMGGGELKLPASLRKCLNSIMETGATPLVVYMNDAPIGLVSVSDHVRSDAEDVIGRLKKLGVHRVGILSGDHSRAVQNVARAVGDVEYWHDLKPQDKLDIIRQLRLSEKNCNIMFVGDGINDAPALAAADMGVAMGAKGTEVALETADVALMNDDIAKLPFLIRLGRRTVRTIKWNIVFGLVFNAVAVFAGGSGFLTPIMGAVVHNIGSIVVVLSSASIAFSAEARNC